MRLIESINKLLSFPDLGRLGEVEGTRELICPPYIVVYRYSDDVVEILHVWRRAREEVKGLTAVGIFLIFGSITAGLAGATLRWPATPLDHIWDLNPRAYGQLSPWGKSAGIAFLFLGAVLTVAAAGWFKRRFWAWILTVCVLATQVLGDVGNLVLGRPLEGLVGIVVAGALLGYLLRPATRAAFKQP